MLIILNLVQEDKLEIFELLTAVCLLVFHVEFKDTLSVVLDTTHVGVLQEGIYCNGEESIKVPNGRINAYGVEEDLQGVDGHVDDVLIFDSQLQYVDNLVYYCYLEVFIIAKTILKYDLHYPNELHQNILLLQLINLGLVISKGCAWLSFKDLQELLKTFKETNRKV